MSKARPFEIAANTNSYSEVGSDMDGETDLRDLLNVILRRKSTLIKVVISVLMVSLLWTFLTPATYRAVTTLQISSEVSNVLDYSVESESSAGSNGSEFYATQFEILKSRALADNTLESLELDGTSFEEYSDSFLVSPIKNSQIVKLSYDSGDPVLAASIVNSIAANYIDLSRARQTLTASSAENFLSQQLTNTKARFEASELNLNRYIKESGLTKVVGENLPSLTAQKIIQLNEALIVASAERVASQAKFEQGRKVLGDVKVSDSLVINMMKGNLSTFQRDYQQELLSDDPDEPLMNELRNQLKNLPDEIAAETKFIRQVTEQSLKTEYLIAKENESQLQHELGLQKKLLLVIRDKDVRYDALLREVRANKIAYEGLLKRLKEVSVAVGVENNNILVLDRAIVPLVKLKPNKILNIILGLIFGVLLGTVAAFIIDFLDDRVNESDDIEGVLRLPLLGTVPLVGSKDLKDASLMVLKEPSSAIAESFRSLNACIMFASEEGIPKILTITSSVPFEGKSVICMNTVVVFAQANYRVLLIDGDLRGPTVHASLELDNSIGLSTYLAEAADVEDVIQETDIPNVSVVTAGPKTANYSELMFGSRLKELFTIASSQYDIIIVDSPAVLGSADALVLANTAKSTMIVAALKESKKAEIQEAHKQLKQARANIIGFVVTKVKS